MLVENLCGFHQNDYKKNYKVNKGKENLKCFGLSQMQFFECFLVFILLLTFNIHLKCMRSLFW